MKRYVQLISVVAFVVGGLGSAWAGGGGAGADRLRDPNGRGSAMASKPYNEAVKKRGKRTNAPGMMQQTH
jgi:hypothetical protein